MSAGAARPAPPSGDGGTEEAPAPLWALIAARDYVAPPEPATEATRGRLARLLRRHRPAPGDAADGKPPAAARPPSVPLLGELPLEAMALDLEAQLGPWLDGEETGRPPIRVIVSPPHGPTAEAVRRWGSARGLDLPTPPEPASLLARDRGWLEQFASSPGSPPALLCGLERCFLRHADALAPVRELLARLTGGRLRTLIVCDSWAWAFLRRALGLRQLERAALTLRAFDAQALQRCLREAAPPGLEYRLLDHDEDLLAGAEPHPLLTALANRALGNPGVAMAIWRELAATGGRADGRVLAYLRPLAQCPEPDLDLLTMREGLFLVHALLLHGGIGEAALAELLPMPGDQITRFLIELESAGIIESRAGRWQVAATAYPRVRARIRAEGYAVDDLGPD